MTCRGACGCCRSPPGSLGASLAVLAILEHFWLCLVPVLCWGLPLLVVSVTAGTGQFGHGYGGGAGSTCGFLSPTYALFPESLLWLALLYNVYSFAAVHRLIRRALRNIGAADLEPQARRELERRMRLWPRFVLYVLSFVCSQAPGRPAVSAWGNERPKFGCLLEYLVLSRAYGVGHCKLRLAVWPCVVVQPQ